MSNNYWTSCPFCNEELIIHQQGRYIFHPTNGCIIQHTCFDYQDEIQRKKWNKRAGVRNALREIQFEIDDSKDEQYSKGLKTAMEIVEVECTFVKAGGQK